MRKLVILLLLTLTGCASLQNAGTARYSIRPFIINPTTGETVCCEVIVENGKEIDYIDAHISKQGDNYTVDLKERGIKAFEGQAIAAGAMKDAIDAAARAAATAALAPIIPLLVPAAGAALMTPGIGAAAVGAGAVVGIDKLSPTD